MEQALQESAGSRVVELSLAAKLEVLQNPAIMVVFEGTGELVEVDLSSPKCARQTSANSTGAELTFQNETGDWCGWRLPLDRVDGVYLDEDHGVLWLTGSGGQRKLGTSNYQDLPGRQGVAINVAHVTGPNQALVIEKILDAAANTQRPYDRLNFTVNIGESAVAYIKQFVGRGVQIKKLDDGVFRSGARQVGETASVAGQFQSPQGRLPELPTLQRIGGSRHERGGGLGKVLNKIRGFLAQEIAPPSPSPEPRRAPEQLGLVDIGQASHQGGRSYQEDNCLAQIVGQGGGLFVFDGMGGHAFGDEAAKRAKQAVETCLPQLNTNNPSEGLLIMVRQANEAVRSVSNIGQPGSTLSGVVIMERNGKAEAWVANVGDSRVYLLRGGQLTQITEDHSWVEEQVRQRILTREQAAKHPQRNLVTRSLGQTNSQPDIFTGEALPGDVWAALTDGVLGQITEQDLQTYLTRVANGKDAQLVVNQMINDAGEKSALYRGDNCTAVVGRIGRVSGSLPPPGPGPR